MIGASDLLELELVVTSPVTTEPVEAVEDATAPTDAMEEAVELVGVAEVEAVVDITVGVDTEGVYLRSRVSNTFYNSQMTPRCQTAYTKYCMLTYPGLVLCAVRATVTVCAVGVRPEKVALSVTHAAAAKTMVSTTCGADPSTDTVAVAPCVPSARK